MSAGHPALPRLFAELRRRRVFRVAAVYAALGWVVVEVSAATFPELMLPTWAPRLVLVLVLLGFPLAVGLAWAYQVEPDRAPGETASADPARAADADVRAGLDGHPARAPLAVAPDAPPRLSLAVLPFENMSADAENEYFSDGITEELLNTLAKVPGLRVAARTSSFAFKGKPTLIPEAAAALRVAHVVEGSVRRVGDRVRITAQLIGAADGYHLWSDTYDRDLSDVFAVQREIAGAIGSALEMGLTRGWDAAISPGRKTVPEAFDTYLRGRFHLQKMTREGMDRALEHFGRAVTLDPLFAPAHAGIARTYYFLADAYRSPLDTTPLIEAAAERAIDLDPTWAEAHAILGSIRGVNQWRWGESEAAIARAIELDPNLAEAYMYRGFNRWTLGDPAEGVPFFERAFALDPLAAFVSELLEWGYVAAGRADDAIRQHAITQDLSPGLVYVESSLGMALVEKGDLEGALRAFEGGAVALGRPSPGRARTLALMGREEEARRTVAEVEEVFARDWMMPELIAEVYCALGDLDSALEWIERGLQCRSAGVYRIRLRPYAALHDDPRFMRVLERVGLPPPHEAYT